MEEKDERDIGLAVASSTFFTWIGVGTLVFHRLEGWSWIDSFYFSVVTITTVGFGDLTPTTPMSRLFTAIYILVGVAIGLVALSLVGAQILRNQERRYAERREKRGGE